MTDISVDDLQDRTVHDREGTRVGKVKQVFLEPKTDAPNFLTVKTSAGEHLIPVASVELDKNKLHVPFDKKTIQNAPSFDLDEGLDSSDQDEVVEYYASQGADEDNNEDSAEEVEEEGSMIRRAERLEVGTEWEETGEATLTKRVVTRTETVEVPLRREELVIERESLTDEEAQEGGDLSEEEEVIVLREERPVVEKQVVGVEKVTVGKRTLSETEEVSADVQEEKIDIDTDTEDDD